MITFRDRKEAGEKLASKLIELKSENALVMCIPNGGVPVGLEIARKLGAGLDVIVVRKMQLPWNTEAGFGAVAPDGSIILNEEMISSFDLTPQIIERQKRKAMDNIKSRLKLYRSDEPYPDMNQKTVIITDDGLASGYTMMAACRHIRNLSPKKIIVAVPCSPISTFHKVQRYCDLAISLNIQRTYPFAVASYYENWYDLDDAEVIGLLKEFQKGNFP